MAGDENLNQDDIEQLLSGAGAGGKDNADAKLTSSSKKEDEIPQNQGSQTLDQDDIEALLNGAVPKAPKAATAKPSPPSKANETDLDGILGQQEIENLLAGVKSQAATSPAAKTSSKAISAVQDVPVPTPGNKSLFPEDGAINDGDVEYLLSQAEEAINSIRNGKSEKDLPEGVRQFNFQHFGGTAASTEMATLDMIKDVDLDLRIELGRTHMYLQDVLKLKNGSVVPLDKLAGDPVDIFVNGRLIAKGEVLVLNDNFCVRIAELIAGADAAG